MEILDPYLLELTQKVHNFFIKYYTSFITMGRDIGQLMCLFVIASEAYKVMTLKKGFDFLAILRPVLFAMVLAVWVQIPNLIGKPFSYLETWAKQQYMKEQVIVEQLQKKRFEEAKQTYQRLQEARAKAKLAEEEIQKADKSVLDEVIDFVGDLWNKAVDMTQTALNIGDSLLLWFLENVLGMIGDIIWKVMVYLTFFIKEIGIGLLIVTGPITFGFSVLPIWKDAWANWVTRFISLNLYGFCAFMIMAASLQLMKYGISVDTQLYHNNFVHTTATPITGHGVLNTFIATLVGAFSLKMVPELVSWIIPTNSSMGVTHFVSGVSSSLKSSASKVASTTYTASTKSLRNNSSTSVHNSYSGSRSTTNQGGNNSSSNNNK